MRDPVPQMTTSGCPATLASSLAVRVCCLVILGSSPEALASFPAIPVGFLAIRASRLASPAALPEFAEAHRGWLAECQAAWGFHREELLPEEPCW